MILERAAKMMYDAVFASRRWPLAVSWQDLPGTNRECYEVAAGGLLTALGFVDSKGEVFVPEDGWREKVVAILKELVSIHSWDMYRSESARIANVQLDAQDVLRLLKGETDG